MKFLMTCKHEWNVKGTPYNCHNINVFTGKPFGKIDINCHLCDADTTMTLLCSVDDEDV